MESLTGPPLPLPPPRLPSPPNPETIKQNLLKKGVIPTPKIIHTLRKKQVQKSNRRSLLHPPPLTPSQQQELDEETHFQILKSEYKAFTNSIIDKKKTKDEGGGGAALIGRPWESLERGELRQRATGSGEYGGGGGGESLKTEHLRELGDIIETERDKLRWLFLDDDDVEFEKKEVHDWEPPWRRSDAEAMKFLVNRLSGTQLSVKDWTFSKMMKHSGLTFTEGQMLKIVGKLGQKGQWRHALSVVEWVYNSKERRQFKSRFVYTKLLVVLGKAGRPREALRIFNLMLGDWHIYPDMPAYHSIAVALGQAGLLKDLIKVIECMKQQPSRNRKNIRRKNWNPMLEPDLVVFNAVLNACVPSRQWKGVSWVFEELRKSGLKPNGATFGLAMEVMMESGKYDLVHEYFGKMNRSGEAPQALTYKVLVKAFWKEGKVDEAVRAVRDMEQRGGVGTACVYYELACCLCNNGRWKEAMVEIQKMRRVHRTKPLTVTFTGMILSSMDGGYIEDCALIFEQSKKHCTPDIGLINAMLKVYGRNDMFFKAKELFEDTKSANYDNNFCLNQDKYPVSPDAYTYSSMLKASASAVQWEYFDYIYKEMVLSGYHLDQGRHAYLLVEASRAGKLHLLEHAFDTILEAGEIPHSSFFTEMVCQAIIQNDVERAVNILNCMAYAPFQVSEKQWMGVFEEYGGRISRVHLEQLLDVVCNTRIAVEASVLNLSRLLQSFCASNGSNAIALDSETKFLPDGYNMESENCKDGFEINKEDSNCEDDSDSEFLPETEKFGLDANGKASPFSLTEYLSSDEPVELLIKQTSKLTDFEDWEVDDDSDSDDELEWDLLTLVNSDGNKLPSADEILGAWKESRREDGTLTTELHIN